MKRRAFITAIITGALFAVAAYFWTVGGAAPSPYAAGDAQAAAIIAAPIGFAFGGFKRWAFK